MTGPAFDPRLLHPRLRLFEKGVELAIRSSAFIVIAFLALIFIFVAREAAPLLTSPAVKEEVTLRKMVTPLPNGRYVWQPMSMKPKYSLIPLLIGTLKVTIVALVLAIPLAVGAAIFTSEFAPPLLREVLKPVVEMLAGIPSVVMGFFAIMVLATWLQAATGTAVRLNALTAGVALSLACIPIVYTVSEDALTAVPQAFRDGSAALGANRWQTAWRVVLPAARPGVFAACVLGFGRAIGETMIVLMSSGNAATTSIDPRESLRTFSAAIASELGEAVQGSAHYHVLFFLGVTLFALTFLSNLVGHWYVTRLQGRLRGRKGR